MRIEALYFAALVLPGLAYSDACSNVRIYSRDTWGARRPKSSRTFKYTPVDLFFVRNSAGSRCFDFDSCATQVRRIQNYHMDITRWSDIEYNFLVGEDGAVYEGRGWNNVGAHTNGYDSQSIGMAVMGNFMCTKPNTAALNAVQNLIQCGVNLGHIISTYRLYGHRDASSSSCPGDALYNEIKTWPHYSRIPLWKPDIYCV
uniref:Peptidoglycan-recognition protein n=1 Tax=Magallana gigas TaxID=29159 RepID=A0A8W8IQ65_MAGGI|nr:peptidoglycan-recognition protein SC2 isoform X3 [Crassostrea gigas]